MKVKGEKRDLLPNAAAAGLNPRKKRDGECNLTADGIESIQTNRVSISRLFESLCVRFAPVTCNGQRRPTNLFVILPRQDGTFA
jgi:hypothetical protein